MEDEIKEVEIDLNINDIKYEGTVTITNGTDINLHDILDDYDRKAIKDGIEFIYVKDILASTALYKAGYTDDIYQCYASGYYIHKDFMVRSENHQKWICRDLAIHFNGDYYIRSECGTYRLKDSYGNTDTITAPTLWWETNTRECSVCGCRVKIEDWDEEKDCCRNCAENARAPIGVIEGYCNSHKHKPVFFGDYESKDKFVGMGFELEVDIRDYNDQDKYYTARNLCGESGLEENEMRFANDGSLSDYGFECISQPHTFKDFWDKSDKWRKMLKYLSSQGYVSHNAGCCGLHVHVSRNAFGSTKRIQDNAIAKVFTFFDDNWDDIVKVSRRRDFDYCEREYLPSYMAKPSKYEGWKKRCKDVSGHHTALNNGNKATFEYRLGRGTLNAWSFFSWIDFCLTITNNAKRITVEKVETNDVVSWLSGIRESTAKYMYKRGAFKSAVVALFPQIEWENDLVDESDC